MGAVGAHQPVQKPARHGPMAQAAMVGQHGPPRTPHVRQLPKLQRSPAVQHSGPAGQHGPSVTPHVSQRVGWKAGRTQTSARLAHALPEVQHTCPVPPQGGGGVEHVPLPHTAGAVHIEPAQHG